MNEDTGKKGNGAPGNRHRSRILALQTLYACEVGTSEEWRTMLDRIAEGSSLSPVVRNYARELLIAVYDQTSRIDAMIKQRAANWDIKRMAVIDRNILRMAITELLHFPQVPSKVVIDEAVELAKAFGAEDSGKFVNGIVDSIHKNVQAESDD